MGKAYSIKECLVSPRRVDGCDKKHNRFLIEKRSGRKPIHLNQPTIKVHLTNPRTEKLTETCALQDTGSTVTLKDKSFKGSLKLDTKDGRGELDGANSSINITEK